MAHYQIRELANLTGIKAHTIRIWEQRYGLLTPERTPTNIRYYTDEDLRRLLNVAVLCDHGYRISRVATMSQEQMVREVDNVTSRASSQPLQVQQLVLALLTLDDVRFEETFEGTIQELGLERAMLEVIYPFLERVGVLWQTSTITPAQEHLMTNVIRQKLVVAIDRLGSRHLAANARRFVLFLPETELHELALLFMYFLLRARGQRVTYLGQNLPVRDLVHVCHQVSPDYLLAVLTVVPERDDVQQYLTALAAEHPRTPLLLYGSQVQHSELSLPATARRFSRMDEFVRWLDQENALQTAAAAD